MKMKYSLKTDIGPERHKNEDSASVYRKSCDDVIAILCDGMGGYKGGEIASKTAVNYLVGAFSNKDFTNLEPDEIALWFEDQIDAIADELSEINKTKLDLSEMGTTLVCALFLKNIVAIFNIGDSRIYIIDNDNKLIQMTSDQNIASELKKVWDISYDEAINFPGASLLTSVIGINKSTKIDSAFLDITHFKYLLLTSDGVHDYLYNHQIETILNSKITLAAKSQKLIKQAVEQNSNDNLTNILIKITK